MTGDHLLSRRGALRAGLASMAGVLAGMLPGCSRQRPKIESTAPEGFRASLALSLRVLQEELRKGHSPAKDYSTLGGINRIRGVLIDGGNEVLLLGDRDLKLPLIELDDLAVALRNAYQAGPAYDRPPGCTIDPRVGAPDPWRIQEVKVLGMPGSAPMGARFVSVDYELKKVSVGTLSLKDGLPSLHEMQKASSPLCSGGEDKVLNRETVHRFWFFPLYPERPRFFRSEGTVWIERPVGVQLLTEQEFLDRTGQRIGAAEADPLARRFAQKITELLATDEVPQYVRLRADFRVVEAAKLIRYLEAPGNQFQYILEEHPIGAAKVPRFVGGIWREEQGEVVCENRVTEEESGTLTRVRSNARVQRYRYLVRGGVGARVELSSTDFALPHSDGLIKLRRRALRSRPAAGALLWRIVD